MLNRKFAAKLKQKMLNLVEKNAKMAILYTCVSLCFKIWDIHSNFCLDFYLNTRYTIIILLLLFMCLCITIPVCIWYDIIMTPSLLFFNFSLTHTRSIHTNYSPYKIRVNKYKYLSYDTHTQYTGQHHYLYIQTQRHKNTHDYLKYK